MSDTITTKPRPYSEDDDRLLLKMFRSNRSYSDIGKALKRSSESVKDRLYRLRTRNAAGKGNHLPVALLRDLKEPVIDGWVPPLDLGPKDRDLVSQCNALGGFPRAEVVTYRGQQVTVWINGQGRPWPTPTTPEAEAA